MEKCNGDNRPQCFHFLHLTISFLVLVGLSCSSQCDRPPAMFIFGDSLIDSGNNNFIPSIAKANYFPYGIDMGAATGRFCNGLTVADFAAKHLGLPSPPPYLSLQSKLTTTGILGGVNYASGAAGILDETGRHLGSRVSFNGQIELFAKTVRLELPLLIEDPKALAQHLESSVFVVNIGSNDYINNYLLPELYPTSRVFSGEQFAKLLINNFMHQLERIYEIGARKILLVRIGPLRCIPSQLATSNVSGCVDRVNELVKSFNRYLVAGMVKANSTLPGSFFVYQHTFDTFLGMIQNPAKYGFSVTDQACCGNGRHGGQVSCLPLQRTCAARDRYIFWILSIQPRLRMPLWPEGASARRRLQPAIASRKRRLSRRDVGRRDSFRQSFAC